MSERWVNAENEVVELVERTHDEWVVVDERGQVALSAERLVNNGWEDELEHAFQDADDAREALKEDGFTEQRVCPECDEPIAADERVSVNFNGAHCHFWCNESEAWFQ